MRSRTLPFHVRPFFLVLGLLGGGAALAVGVAAFAYTLSDAPAPAASPDKGQAVAQTASPTPVSPPSATRDATATETPSDGRADQIRQLLDGRPLAEYADEMIATSDGYGIDWRYLPILSFLESGGGVAACGGNAWGWDACNSTFPDYLTGMDRVARALASYPYAGRSVATVLCIWQSGGGCTSPPAVAYAYLGAPYFARLGDPIALPPQLASQAVATATAPPPATTEAAAGTAAPTSTPAASGTPATPQATATIDQPPTGGTSSAGTPGAGTTGNPSGAG